MNLATAVPADAEIPALPEGWALTRIGEICEINPAKPPSGALSADAPVTFVPMPAVDAVEGAITAPQTRAFAEVRKGFTSFRNNDVIMAKITPCMENGKAAIARNLSNGLGFGSTEFHVLRPTMAVLPEYVYSFIRQESYRRAAESEMTGSVGQKRVPESFLELTEFPLPPPAEQVRIVEKVTALLNAVKNSSNKLNRVTFILKRFRQAVLTAACSGKLTEEWRQKNSGGLPFPSASSDTFGHEDLPDLPESWHWKPIGQISEIRGGIQKQPKRTPKANAFPYLRVANVLRGRLDLSEIHRMELFAGELGTYRLQRGDLLVVEGNGSVTEIGRSAIWSGEIGDCVHQNHIIRVRLRECLPAYANAFWNSPVGTSIVGSRAVTTSGLYSLSTKKIAAIPLPLPPQEEQHEIVLRMNVLLHLADAVERRVKAATQNAAKLAQSVLTKALRGELVPTEAELARCEGRDYEPASVLLERIKKGLLTTEKSGHVKRKQRP